MSVFMKGEKCELRVREENEAELQLYTEAIMRGDTTKYLFTGSTPMRWIDSAAVWKKEREAGDVLFGIWAGDDEHHDFFVGICGLHGHRDIYKSWELRILIFDKGAIGKGIGTEACSMLVDYAFNRLNAHRVWLGVNADNAPAIACYKKVGFKEEGRLRDEIFYYGKYVDAVRMGILENEWRSIAQ